MEITKLRDAGITTFFIKNKDSLITEVHFCHPIRMITTELVEPVSTPESAIQQAYGILLTDEYPLLNPGYN